jgi:cystathionine beta-lyase/cystathionine gamma-synthase
VFYENDYIFFNKKGYGTKFVHAGSEVDLNIGSIVPSITLNTTFLQNHQEKSQE